MSQILKTRSGSSPAALPATSFEICGLKHVFPPSPMGPRGTQPRDAGGSAPPTLALLITEALALRTSQLLFCSRLQSALRATASPHRFKRSYTTCAGFVRWDKLHPRGPRWQQEVRGEGYGRVLRIPFCVWLPGTTTYKPPARQIILRCCAHTLIQI